VSEPTRSIACTCSKCKKEFLLTNDNYPKTGSMATNMLTSDLDVRSSESDGVYAIYVDCPYCKHQHELY